MAASPRGAFTATVLANRVLCTDHYRLTLALARFPASVPGQFVHLDCRDVAAPESELPRAFDWPPGRGGPRVVPADPDFAAPVAFLPAAVFHCRPSPAQDGATEMDIIHRVVGRGTTALARLHPGRQVSLLGPLGVGFQVPADLQCACLVGGGVGIPPMLYLADAGGQGGVVGGGANCRRVAFFGAQRRDLLPVTVSGPAPSPEGEPLLERRGTHGLRLPGRHHHRRRLAGHERLRHRGPAAISRVPSAAQHGDLLLRPHPDDEGRRARRRRVWRALPGEPGAADGLRHGDVPVVHHPASVPTRPRRPPETEWKYKLTCTDGPVFDTRDIVW